MAFVTWVDSERTVGYRIVVDDIIDGLPVTPDLLGTGARHFLIPVYLVA